MEARKLIIENKLGQHHGFLARLSDFSYREGGLVNPSLIIDNPQISLYCLDDRRQQAIFVQLPPDVNLSQAPFVYQTQYEQAQELITVAYQHFNQLADYLPEVKQPIFIYTTGRSGSTLLHHAFNESQSVVSLSEADVASQFANLRHNTNGKREAELRQLAHSSLRFLFKSYHGKDIDAHVLKFRSHGLQVMDLFQTVFPQAKNIFLYRPALGFVSSGYRIYQKHKRPAYSSFKAWQSQYEQFEGTTHAHLAQYLPEENKGFSLIAELTLRWIAAMEWYLSQVQRGISALAINYNDLIKFKVETLEQIFSHCGLPPGRVQQALRAYKRDSQADTALAREKPKEGNKHALNKSQIELVMAILQRHPVLNISGESAPGHQG